MSDLKNFSFSEILEIRFGLIDRVNDTIKAFDLGLDEIYSKESIAESISALRKVEESEVLIKLVGWK